MDGSRIAEVRRSYDAVADEYARRIAGELAGKPLDRALLDAFAGEVRPLGTCCDVGCGPAHVTDHLQKRGLDVVGVDLSPALLAEARRLFPTLRLAVADMRALPLASASLGGVAAFYSLIHLTRDDRRAAIAELRRVLVARGLLLVAFHVGAETVHLDEWWGRAVHLDFRFLDPAEVRAELEAAGFTVEATVIRAPYRAVEHPSERAILLARRR
jgi:SAM-dependent methyltransferase